MKKIIIIGSVLIVLLVVVFSIIGLTKNNQTDISGRVIESLDKYNIKCSDSDNGKDYTKSGEVEYCDNEGKCSTESDQCSGKKLKEWYCDGYERKFEDHDCENECDNGECVSVVSEKKYIYTGSGNSYSGGSSGGGSGGSGESSPVVSNEKVDNFNLGEIGSEHILEIEKGDNILFTMNNINYKINLEEKTDTQISLRLVGTSLLVNVTVGESKNVDINNDSNKDIYVKVKSINIVTSKVNIMLGLN